MCFLFGVPCLTPSVDTMDRLFMLTARSSYVFCVRLSSAPARLETCRAPRLVDQNRSVGGFRHFEARCYDFDRKHPIQACGPDVPSLQKALDAEFHAALKKAFPKEPLMQPHLLVKLSLVPNLPEKSSSPAAEKMPMLPRCCSARAFVRSDE